MKQISSIIYLVSTKFALMVLISMTACSAIHTNILNAQQYDNQYDDYGVYGYDDEQEIQATYDDYAIFYETLSPHGNWFYIEQYGYVWMPNVQVNWRPYVDNGRWEWTNYGWTWISDYEWGWAPFHYGRWIQLPEGKWVWIPDTIWGPAWVAWRYTDTHIGWAPLPPGSYWDSSYGLEITVPIPMFSWSFIPGNVIFETYLTSYIISYNYINQYYSRSTPATTYVVYNSYPVCSGVDIDIVFKWTGLRRTKIQVSIETNMVGKAGYYGNSITLYRPSRSVMRNTRVKMPPPPRIAPPQSLYKVRPPPPPSAVKVHTSQRYYTGSTVPKAYSNTKKSYPKSNPYNKDYSNQRQYDNSQNDNDIYKAPKNNPYKNENNYKEDPYQKNYGQKSNENRYNAEEYNEYNRHINKNREKIYQEPKITERDLIKDQRDVKREQREVRQKEEELRNSHQQLKEDIKQPIRNAPTIKDDIKEVHKNKLELTRERNELKNAEQKRKEDLHEIKKQR